MHRANDETAGVEHMARHGVQRGSAPWRGDMADIISESGRPVVGVPTLNLPDVIDRVERHRDDIVTQYLVKSFGEIFFSMLLKKGAARMCIPLM